LLGQSWTFLEMPGSRAMLFQRLAGSINWTFLGQTIESTNTILLSQDSPAFPKKAIVINVAGMQ
jgi:hypothetical protein